MKLKLFLSVLILSWVVALGNRARAANISSFTSGNWDSAGTWQTVPGGSHVVPTSADDVTIQNGNVVTLNIPTAQAKSLTVTGSGSKLVFSRAAGTNNTLTTAGVDPDVFRGNATVFVTFNGVLDMGTELSPIPAGTTAQLILAKALTPNSNLGLIIDSNGIFTSCGANKSPVAVATADLAGAPGGATSLLVPLADTVGWAVGDTITIGQTDYSTIWVNQTEERVITSLSSGDPRQVGWSGGLIYHHTAAWGIRVANLTRNVVIASAGGAAVPTTTAFVQNSSTLSGGFRAVRTEFSRLAESGDSGGVTFDESFSVGAGVGAISSSTLHDGGGLAFYGTSGGQVTHSIFYKNTGPNSYADQWPISTDKYFAFNDFIYSSDQFGLYLLDTGHDVVLSNNVYSNAAAGITLGHYGSYLGDVVDGNRVYCNKDEGINVSSDEGAIISSNTVFNNNGRGINYDDAVSSLISGNTAWNNAGVGFDGGFGVSNMVIGGNTSYLNKGHGFVLGGSGRFFANLSYNNDGNGIDIDNTDSSFVFQDVSEGYTAGGALSANGLDGVFINTGAGMALTLRSCRIHGIWDFSWGPMPAGDSILSIDQDFSTGTVRVFGTPTLAAGNDLTLDYAQPIYHSTATVPRAFYASDTTASPRTFSAAVVGGSLDDAAVVSQVVVIRWDGDSGLWRVEGSSTPSFGTIPATGGSLTTPQFQASLTVSGAPQPGDRLAFSLLSASKDSGVQKKLLFSSTDFSVPAGNMASYGLAVAPGASLTLRGISTSSTTVGLLTPATDRPYNFVSSGTLTMEYVTVDSATAPGLVLSGSGGVAMSSVTFDNIGAAGGAYITATNLTSNATFYNLSFNDTPHRTPYSVYVTTPGDGGMNWYIATFSGIRSGPARDSDPDSRIVWGDSKAPDTPTLFAASDGPSEGDVNLAWVAPMDNESQGPDPTVPLKGGMWKIFRSTDATAVNVTVPPAQSLTIPFSGVATGIQGYADTGLRPGAMWYYRLWAVNGAGNPSLPAATTTWVAVRTPPVMASFSISPQAAGAPWTSVAIASFTKAMDMTSMATAVSWTLVKDHLGVSTSAAMGVTVSSDTSGHLITITPTTLLTGNGTYVVAITTAATDVNYRAITSSGTIRFTTIMDHTVHNVVTEGVGGMTVDLSSYTLAVNGFLSRSLTSDALSLAATQKLVKMTGDPLKTPLSGTTVGLTALDVSSAPISTFASAVTVSLPYDPATPAGRAKNLAVYWLNQTDDAWVRLPTLNDSTSHRVTAPALQPAIFAVLGGADTDLSTAHPYPVPWTHRSGKPGITFTNIGDLATIRIFTLSGVLVREIATGETMSQYDWDLKNASGEPVASGIYYYEIS